MVYIAVNNFWDRWIRIKVTEQAATVTFCNFLDFAQNFEPHRGDKHRFLAEIGRLTVVFAIPEIQYLWKLNKIVFVFHLTNWLWLTIIGGVGYKLTEKARALPWIKRIFIRIKGASEMETLKKIGKMISKSKIRVISLTLVVCFIAATIYAAAANSYSVKIIADDNEINISSISSF